MMKTKKNTRISYLSIDQSNALKGLLMLLIILGHNHILVPQTGQLIVYLYKFHIYCFFILPFLYNKRTDLNIKNIVDIFVKNWIPYLFFFLISYFIYHVIVSKDKFFNINFLYGFLNGSTDATKNTAGFICLWFMPAYCSMSIVMLIYNNTNKYVKPIILLIAFTFYCFSGYSGFTIRKLFPIIPFAITQGFYYFTFGFVTKLLLDKILYIQYIGALIFIIISVLYWTVKLDNFYLVFSFSAFLFVYTFRNLLQKIPLLINIGKYSFPIYLLHIFVYNFLEILMQRTLLFGFIDYVLTVAISMLIGYWMINIDFIRKLIFPKNLNELKSMFVK